MPSANPLDVGRRERQIMEAVYARGQVSVGEALEALPDPPTYSGVRAMLNALEQKGHLRRKKVGRKYVYLPTVPRDRARRSAMRRLLATFFNGSATQAVASLIDLDKGRLSADELDRLARLIEEAKRGESGEGGGESERRQRRKP